MTQKKNKKFSKIMKMHYWKLTYRSFLFLSALILYIYNWLHKTGSSFSGFDENKIILAIIWIIYAVEMILRFLPSSFESMGCQKQFSKNYYPADSYAKHSSDSSLTHDHPGEKPEIVSPLRTFAVVAAWFTLNGIIGLLYYNHIINEDLLLLISLAYSVCDLICILFFCPFQTWFLKNRCCCTCRIYNWDFAMMFTPLIFVKTLFAQSLVFLSLVLLIRWEYVLHRHPEYFSEKTNASLSCVNCQEKLCHHKSQLKSFWKREKSCRN